MTLEGQRVRDEREEDNFAAYMYTILMRSRAAGRFNNLRDNRVTERIN